MKVHAVRNETTKEKILGFLAFAGLMALLVAFDYVRRGGA